THLGQEASGEIIPLLSPFELFSFKRAFGRGFGGKKSKKALRSKSLTRQEVLSLIQNLKKGSSENIRLVDDKKALDLLWEKLTKNATKIDETPISIRNKNTHKITQERLIRYKLGDGTNLIYRTNSSRDN
ncbi:hypothetical protein, partial [Campylobacter troglodytis]|uniref:hypothetical protein n=1 Tax=Campylobacter troglodytis TaxID=654363 RepID=UPI00163B7745